MEELRERVAAVERALTDGESDLTALAEGAATADRVESLAADVERLEDDVAELQAATQALRGYVGNVRSVNEGVEERADGALAAVEKLEDRVERLEERTPNRSRDGGPRTAGQGDGATGTESAKGGPTGRDGHHRAAASSEPGFGACRACGRPTADERTWREGNSATGPNTGPVGRAAADGGDVASDSATRRKSRVERRGSQLARERGRDRLTADRGGESADGDPAGEGLLQRFRERL